MRSAHQERGFAMVFAIGALLVLAVLALAIVAIVVTEKRNESAEYAHDRAFYSADAAGEAGVNWLRSQKSPAATVDSLSNVRVAQPDTLTKDHLYQYSVRYVTRRFRPGFSVEYKDYVYVVAASGTSAQQSQAALEVNATRLYKEGY